jgi:hypothetical protein
MAREHQINASGDQLRHGQRPVANAASDRRVRDVEQWMMAGEQLQGPV